MSPPGASRHGKPAVFHVRMGGCSGCGEMVDHAMRDGRSRGRPVECSTPRHADVLVVTGLWLPELAGPALDVISQAPSRRRLVVAGDCALGRGLVCLRLKTSETVSSHLASDLEISGCPIAAADFVEGVRRVVG